MTFQPIRRILPHAIHGAGISRQVTAARVIEEAARSINALWGEEKAAYIQFISFAEGVLKLHATAPAALQEFKREEIAFQNELNRRLGSRVVLRMVYSDH